MECSCFEADVNDFSTCLSECTVNARKEHRCGECRKTIAAGEKYRREVILVDGDIRTEKTCLDCLSVRDAFCCSYYYGEVWELVSENLKNEYEKFIPWGKIAKLTPAARDRVCRIIEESWEARWLP